MGSNTSSPFSASLASHSHLAHATYPHNDGASLRTELESVGKQIPGDLTELVRVCADVEDSGVRVVGTDFDYCLYLDLACLRLHRQRDVFDRTNDVCTLHTHLQQ